MRQLLTVALLLRLFCGAMPQAFAALPVKTVSRAEYLAELQQLRQVVAGCGRTPAACDPEKQADPALKTELATTLTVDNPDGSQFTVRWNWLRTALAAAADPRSTDRGQRLQQADARLAADAASPPVSPPDLGAGRRAADAVLKRREFRSVEQPDYLAAKFAALALLLDKLFSGVGSLFPHSAWIGLLLEWGAFAVAASGLLVWVWRMNRQSRVQIVTEASTQRAAWQRRSDDWAARAEAEAARGEWREAVHCLYWSAIVMLEGRKLWRENGARTPREYLALLEPGTPRQGALAGLTHLFERIWYGLRAAAEPDYQRARALLEELRLA